MKDLIIKFKQLFETDYTPELDETGLGYYIRIHIWYWPGKNYVLDVFDLYSVDRLWFGTLEAALEWCRKHTNKQYCPHCGQKIKS